ncbi:hypothetical protein EW026_g1107 [Hermanssonia centrifuga]|uniref:Serine aminopeptidase S33 domain-containing protein n=1 Tax=Hermanssonia centrifuga TaxID=98765 RepID=A0A4S4KUA2_9APHY|nr:hypothetical protein EW026_g1107 [Hermanssonia centrifuga]
MDAQSGLDYICSHPALAKSPVILYGQSIGGAVSIDLASRNPLAIRALILENTFLSLPRLVPTALPFLGPFAFLCHQKWDSASKVPLIPRKTPILMLSGAMDEVVPPEHMRGLWEIVVKREAGTPAGTGTNQPAGPGKLPGVDVGGGDRDVRDAIVSEDRGKTLSKFIEYEQGTHNDTCVQPGYWAAVAEFLASLGKGSS